MASTTRGLEPVSDVSEDISNRPRYALVFGNSTYKHPFWPLANPSRDVDRISKTLTSLQFRVTQETNLSFDKMKKVLEDFARSIHDDAVVLFYFSGHGVQIDGKNFLIGSDDDYSTGDIADKALSDEAVLARLSETGRTDDGRDRTLIVLLDACRTPPAGARLGPSLKVATEKGVAVRPENELGRVRSRGVLLGYSTSGGRTALDGPPNGNSPFAASLVAILGRPRIPIEQTTKDVRDMVQVLTQAPPGSVLPTQTPSFVTSIQDTFYFEPRVTRKAPIHPWVYGVGAAGLAALLAGAVTGPLAASKGASAKTACPEPARSAVGCGSGAVAESEEALRLAKTSNVLLGLGAGAVVAGFLGIALRGEVKSQGHAAGISVVSESGGVMLRAWTKAF